MINAEYEGVSIKIKASRNKFSLTSAYDEKVKVSYFFESGSEYFKIYNNSNNFFIIIKENKELLFAGIFNPEENTIISPRVEKVNKSALEEVIETELPVKEFNNLTSILKRFSQKESFPIYLQKARANQ